jgi:hypothetical protein
MCLSHTRAESREAVKLASSLSQMRRLMVKLTKAFGRWSWISGRIAESKDVQRTSGRVAGGTRSVSSRRGVS